MVRIRPPAGSQHESSSRRRRRIRKATVWEVMGACTAGALLTMSTSFLTGERIIPAGAQQPPYKSLLRQKSNANDSLYGDRLIVPRRHAQHEPNPAYDDIWPKVVWLMSFPNSGTSFTLQYTRSATNASTATNYGKEGDIKDEDSVPIHPSLATEGPWLLRYPNQPTKLPQKYILTKTHCTGVCDGAHCIAPDSYLETPRSFRRWCQKGSKAMYDPNEGTLQTIKSMYNEAMVHKAIHMFRNPFDNIVARFHLVWKREMRADESFAEKFPNNADGFRAWCKERDKLTDDSEHLWLNKILQDANMDGFFCHQEFLLYIQWHNLAFSSIRELGISTLVLLYEDYAQDFDLASKRLLHFLEVDPVKKDDGDSSSEDEMFKAGKTYLDFYSTEEKAAIEKFLFELASDDTWEYLKHYF